MLMTILALVVSAAIDSTTLFIGDQTDLHLQATCGAGEQVALPVLGDNLIPGIEIVDAADSTLLAKAITKMAESGTGSRPLYNEAYSEISYKQHFDEIADDTINAFKLWKSR